LLLAHTPKDYDHGVGMLQLYIHLLMLVEPFSEEVSLEHPDTLFSIRIARLFVCT
jgi:hypothetical protein